MRSEKFGVTPNLLQSIENEIALKIFYRICIAHYFDKCVITAVNNKRINIPIYLSLGQESISAAMSLVISDFMIFSQHRCHATYLSFGGDPEKLRDELLSLPTGCSGGRAGSNCLQSHSDTMQMFGHHGLIGENVPLGVGAALGSGKPVVCFFGDGAAEEDYVFSAMGFAVSQKLPVLFVCENNDLSILTPIKDRRTWSITKIAEALGMPTAEFSDDPWTIMQETTQLSQQLPAFIDCYTCRANWHAGVGTDGPTEWNRFNIIKAELNELGLHKSVVKLENEARQKMERLWEA